MDPRCWPSSSLAHGLSLDPPLIQVLTGPRQVGKTTLALQTAEAWRDSGKPVRTAAADDALPGDRSWLAHQWSLARRDAAESMRPALLVLDEVQKVDGWSETVKGLWDADRRERHDVRVLLLGSSALLLSTGTTESLAGRFLLHRVHHWGLDDHRDVFGWDFDRWLLHGGYPGAARFSDEETLWRSYVRDALVEPAIARDVVAMHRIAKPTLLRHLFALACRFPAQPLSYNKMLGQLQDAGNTTTLAHYLDLLETAWLVAGLNRFSPGGAKSRGSSPKFIVFSNALVHALDTRSTKEAQDDGRWWGRLVENAVGARFLQQFQGTGRTLSWWREGDDEVDFVIDGPEGLIAVEVKAGTGKSERGMARFLRQVPTARPLRIGGGGVPIEEFFLHPVERWFR